MARNLFTLDDHVPRTPTINNQASFQLPMQDRRNFGSGPVIFFAGVPMGWQPFSAIFAEAQYVFMVRLACLAWLISIFVEVAMESGGRCGMSPKVDGERAGLCHSNDVRFGMIWLGSRVKQMMVTAGRMMELEFGDLQDGGSSWFLLCATQDIAVDGWALTLLTPGNISYASTAQTVGLTAGSSCVYRFPGFQLSDFATKVPKDASGRRGYDLGGYLTFWAGHT